MKSNATPLSVIAFALTVGACSNSAQQINPPGAGGTKPSDTPAAPKFLGPQSVLPQSLRTLAPELPAFAALGESLKAAAALDTTSLATAYPALQATLPYDPSTSQGLATIAASDLRLTPAELAKLGSEGMVLLDRQRFPTFLRGYAAVYHQHLPVFVSADAMMDAVHRSYDAILKSVEATALVPALRKMLILMRTSLSTAGAGDTALADADLYLAVALSLLSDEVQGPVAGAKAADIKKFFDGAKAADGLDSVTIFDSERVVDFSSFKPRSHYDDQGTLSRYFRCMIWLGNVDLRIIETLPNGDAVFRPRQFAAMLSLSQLLVGEAATLWQQIDDAIRLFVGESDSMTPPQVASLLKDLGGVQKARTLSNDEVAKAIVSGGYGAQQISSHYMVNDGHVETLPLNRSFLILGQRYVVDSHVFSNVVYDRLKDERMMPSPLDVGFAALHNNTALVFNDDVKKFPSLPAALGKMRVLVDSHDNQFWSANLYNLWLSALRELSPTAPQEGLPSVAKTESWGRRVVNAQLGSWAQLRHDTLLYAKQSFTGIPGCNFPDAYVEPYPEFFAALGRFASAGVKVADLIKAQSPGSEMQVLRYFQNLSNAASMLQQMALAQRASKPFTEAQMSFINDAIRIDKESVVCTTIDAPNGWYAGLFYERMDSIKEDLTVADVHTQPADESGATVGRVLHVGTSYPRLMVMTAETCEGPRAYVGVAYAYHERITDNFERLTDGEWQTAVNATPPASPPWLAPILAP